MPVKTCGVTCANQQGASSAWSLKISERLSLLVEITGCTINNKIKTAGPPQTLTPSNPPPSPPDLNPIYMPPRSSVPGSTPDTVTQPKTMVTRHPTLGHPPHSGKVFSFDSFVSEEAATPRGQQHQLRRRETAEPLPVGLPFERPIRDRYASLLPGPAPGRHGRDWSCGGRRQPPRVDSVFFCWRGFASRERHRRRRRVHRWQLVGGGAIGRSRAGIYAARQR